MQEGVLYRDAEVELAKGEIVQINSQRFCNYATKELGCCEYKIKSFSSDIEIKVRPYLDFDVKNENANADEKLWTEVDKQITKDGGSITAEIMKTAVAVCAYYNFAVIGGEKTMSDRSVERSNYIAKDLNYQLAKEQSMTINKMVAITTSSHHPGARLEHLSQDILKLNTHLGFDQCKRNHLQAWQSKWEESDINISGDIASQQDIRFNIFHLNQTYRDEKDSGLKSNKKL